MTTKNTGGNAFPSHGSMGEVAQEGMTLRDYFAAKALTGMVSATQVMGHVSIQMVADESYAYADAMLRAREAK